MYLILKIAVIIFLVFFITPMLSFSGNWSAIIYSWKNPAPERTALFDLINAEVYLTESGNNIYFNGEYYLKNHSPEELRAHHEQENTLPEYVTYARPTSNNKNTDIIIISPIGEKYRETIIKTAKHPCKSRIYQETPDKYENFQPKGAGLGFGGIKLFTSCRNNAYDIEILKNGNLSVTYRRPWL